MSTKDTLIKARDIIAERGVARTGTYIDKEGCKVCALGAVQLALGGEIRFDGWGSHARIVVEKYNNPEYDEPVQALQHAMDSIVHGTSDEGEYGDITDYNDGSSSDSAVLAVFDKAIGDAE